MVSVRGSAHGTIGFVLVEDQTALRLIIHHSAPSQHFLLSVLFCYSAANLAGETPWQSISLSSRLKSKSSRKSRWKRSTISRSSMSPRQRSRRRRTVAWSLSLSPSPSSLSMRKCLTATTLQSSSMRLSSSPWAASLSETSCPTYAPAMTGPWPTSKA